MKILLSWLNDFAHFADVDDAEAVAAIASDLTSLGLAVEEVVPTGRGVDGVVSARVLRVETHPDAAKVRRVWVDAGDGEERHVWCGASNMGAGDLVPLATLGTAMPDGRTIERRGILGIDSEGMLCSGVELGVNDDDGGILLLDPSADAGLPYTEVLGTRPDVLFDLDVTRNRPDCWSHLGVARDLAARRGLDIAMPTMVSERPGAPRSVPVEIIAGDRCARFTTTVLSGVRVTESPAWIRQRLSAAGMRPINNVVDVSNLVMLELGQPNHAYDLEQLAGESIRVRLASDGERLTTLDGVERTLDAADLLICDGEDRPIGLGGVMGGLDSEISESTTVVALETAWFTPRGVMETAARHGLRSEASARYERGVDPYVIDAAVGRFIALLAESCPDLVAHAGGADERSASLPEQTRTAVLRGSVLDRVLGTSLDPDRVTGMLAAIGFDSVPVEEGLEVSLPSWRPDCAAEIDVVEEVARLHGYENIGRTVPRADVFGHLSPAQRRRRRVREVLVGLGVSEAMPNPFLAPDELERAGLSGPHLSITNPLAVEESALRTSLRPGLLKALSYNESHRQEGVALFEIGHTYPPSEEELPDEQEVLAVVLAGCEAPAAVAVWDEVCAALGVGAQLDQSSPGEGMHPTRSATLRAGRDLLGVVGEVHPAVLAAFEVSERVAVLEVRLDVLLARSEKVASATAVARTPSSDLDLAFVLDDEVPAERLTKALRQGAGSRLVSLDLFDVFRGDSLGDGRRSLAYRLRLQDPTGSLTDGDIATIRQACVDGAERIGATLR